MGRHHFKTVFNIQNIPISIGYSVYIDHDNGDNYTKAKVVGGLMNKNENEIDRIGVMQYKENGDDIEWETIIIASIDKVLWIFADDKERRQWRRIDSDHFILNKKRRWFKYPRGDPSDPWKITRTSWNRRS